MLRKVSGLVVALAMVMGMFIMPASVQAGGGPIPRIEWFNPASVSYGGWPLSAGVYLTNPTGVNVKFRATAWLNGAVVDPFSTYVHGSVSSYNIGVESVTCDGSGCLATMSGVIPAYNVARMIVGMESGRSLGKGFTLGSVRVNFENYGEFYKEGKIDLVEGPGFSAKIELYDPFDLLSGTSGFVPLAISVTDRTLNSFQLVGVGTDCSGAAVEDYPTRIYYDSTVAQWLQSVYIPSDAGGRCTITALIKTNQTVVSATYAIKR